MIVRVSNIPAAVQAMEVRKDCVDSWDWRRWETVSRLAYALLVWITADRSVHVVDVASEKTAGIYAELSLYMKCPVADEWIWIVPVRHHLPFEWAVLRDWTVT